MPLSSVENPYFRSDAERVEQGDIFRDATLVEWAEKSGTDIVVRERSLPYCVVLTQDCDLEHDFSNRANQESPTKDKYLQSILLCPAYPAQTFRHGEHLAAIGLTMQRFNSQNWPRVTQNNEARYHYLQEAASLQIPALVIDFKHYFTAPRDIVYRGAFLDKYLATVEIVFRDHLSSRFAHYLSRVGLPELTVA